MKNPTAKKVLIVEDDMLLSLVEERLIEKLGFEVLDKVVSGEEAVEKVRELQPDVILMDIILKGKMDGIEAMEKIRKEFDTPVIYLSGNSDRFNYERAKKTGFTEYLVKPITSQDLEEPFEKAFAEETETITEQEDNLFSIDQEVKLNKTG